MLIEISLINDCGNLSGYREQRPSSLPPKIKLAQKTPHVKGGHELDRSRHLNLYNKGSIINLIFIYSPQPANEFTSKNDKRREISRSFDYTTAYHNIIHKQISTIRLR